jgi:RNA polymerase sigma-70 factor (ECF subfamily)
MTSDEELVARATAGDQDAFGQLVSRWERPIYALAYRTLRREEEARDVVQDAFLRAYRGLPSFRGDSSFYSWLYRIATNAAFSFLKKDAGEVHADEAAEPFEPGVTDEQTPERMLLARQIGDAVERAMARLQPELAEALTLYEVEGKSYAEVAQMMGTPIGTVRTRIFRAREFIAQRLEPVLGPARDRRW